MALYGLDHLTPQLGAGAWAAPSADLIADVRLGSRAPATTEDAQYALGFPLAAMLVRRQLGTAEVTAEGMQTILEEIGDSRPPSRRDRAAALYRL